MFNRRMLVALAACLAVSASSAMAGGGGGSKKNATIEVHNQSDGVIYAFVDVKDSKIEAASLSDDPIAAFKKLGGQEIEVGGHASFSVRAGKHTITAVDVEEIKDAIGQETIYVAKGATEVVEFHAPPALN